MRRNDGNADMVTEPIISRERILRRAEELGMRQKDLTNKLGVSESQGSRGLKTQSWLSERIAKIAQLLQTNTGDLVEESAPTALITRLCGVQTERGMLLPDGCELRMLFLNPTVGWSLYLVAPTDVVQPQVDDYVLVELRDGSAKIGRYNIDQRLKTVIRIVSDDPKEDPKTIEKVAISAIFIIVAPLGWNGVRP